MIKRTIINTLRHGHTQFNREKRYAGTIDIPLSAEGIRQTKTLSKIIKNMKFDLAITSSLKRSIETAKILFYDSIPLIKSKLCNERNFGIMEGKTWEDIKNLVPPVMLIQVGNDLHTVNPSYGEPFEKVWERAKKFRSYLFRNFMGKDIIVISHGVFLQIFHGILNGVSLIESLSEYPTNLEINKFIFENYRKVSYEKVMYECSTKYENF